jgi:hypothetical protein
MPEEEDLVLSQIADWGQEITTGSLRSHHSYHFLVSATSILFRGNTVGQTKSFCWPRSRIILVENHELKVVQEDMLVFPVPQTFTQKRSADRSVPMQEVG